MEENRRLAKDRQLFHGAMGAGLSHEINNVFAIIGELTGLLEDLSKAAADRLVAPEKLDSVLARVGAQIERGRDLVRLLNQFSHSTEVLEQSLTVSDVLGHMVALSGRLARLRKVTILTDGERVEDRIHGDLFNLQHIIFRCIEIGLLISAMNTTLKATISSVQGGIRVSVINETSGNETSGNGSPEIREKIATAVTIAERLGGELTVGTQNHLEIELFLPNALRPLVR